MSESRGKTNFGTMAQVTSLMWRARKRVLKKVQYITETHMYLKGWKEKSHGTLEQ